MLLFLVGLFVGVFMGAMLMCLMRVATINDLLNRNKELEQQLREDKKKVKK